MNHKRLKRGEIKVINIGRDAIFEWLYESMQEQADRFFDIKDSTKVLFHFNWNKDSDQFTCIIEPEIEEDGKPVFHDFDFSAIREKVGETTSSLFSSYPMYQTLNFKKDPSLLE